MNQISNKAIIMSDVIIGDDVIIEDGVFIDYHCIIRDHVHIEHDSRIGAGCILGEYLADFYDDLVNKPHTLSIGEHALIRSESIIYGDTKIGAYFQTGHRVTIREKTSIGHHTHIGTLSDIQGFCTIGNYVNLHSNVHVGQQSTIEDYVWLFPYVILTNDPTPPSEYLEGVTIKKFAVVCAGAVLLPGVTVGSDSLIGAGALVSRNAEEGKLLVGNPAKVRGAVSDIKSHITGQQVYPWRDTFNRGMPWEKIGYAAYLELCREKEREGNDSK